jgi:outer membrane protein insertion porin family
VVDPGRRVYVRQVNITGNAKTRDVVVRREMRQFESSWFDSDKIRLSKERIGRLGYFTETDISTVDVPGSPDQVDVSVAVKEKPTGAINDWCRFFINRKIDFVCGYQSRECLRNWNCDWLNFSLGKINQN